MSFRHWLSRPLVAALVGIALLLVVAATTAQEKGIPKTWDEKKLHEMELPLVGLDKPVKHAPPEFYDAVPVLPIAKSYPVYHPDKEPKGYMEALREKEPEAIEGTPPGLSFRVGTGVVYVLNCPI